MEEGDFLVRVTIISLVTCSCNNIVGKEKSIPIEILGIKLLRKVLWELDTMLILLRKNMIDNNIFIPLTRALLTETFRPDDFGIGVRSLPRAELHVVLDIGGDDVAHITTERGNRSFGFGGESYGGEYC